MKKAFSLVELLVVVAIIAVLAAIAVPVYIQYTVRAQVAQVFPLMNSLIQQVQKNYEATGSFPAAPYFPGSSAPFTTSSSVCAGGNASVGSGGSAWISVSIPNYPNVAQLLYQISSDGKGAVIGVTFANLNIPSFSYSPGVGTYSSVFFGTREINGTMVNVCGGNSLDGATAAIPPPYMPDACNCNLIGQCRTAGFLNTGLCHS